jgi:predicted methyltransferase
VNLRPASIDLAFISDTYHHFEYPRDILRALHEALKPGGEVVIVDFRRVPGMSSPWVMGHVRAGANTVRVEMESAGFALVEQRDFMRTQYYLRFRKDGDGAETRSAGMSPVTP